MYSLRHEHKKHTLSWLAEKRATAEWRERVNRCWVIVGVIAAIIAAVTGIISVLR
jgi:hypothetical protein